jgi:hypothetical protein
MTRSIGGVLTIVLLGALVGCQAGSPRPAAPTPAATSAAPAPARGVIPDSAFADHRPFTGPAVSVYGQPALLEAYKETVTFTFEAGWDPVLIRKNDTQLSTSDFAVVRSYLTPARRRSFDATFAKVVRSDRAAIGTLEDVAFFGITGAGGLTPTRSGNTVTGRRFTDAAVATAPRGRLSLSFAAKASIRLQDAAGHRYELPTGRTVRYVLVRNTGPTRTARPFLIDSWTVTVSVSRPKAASPGS